VELSQVSSFFDRTEVTDPVTGLTLFRCQLMAYDESRRDSYPAHRRVISVAPGTVIPPARALDIYGETWIVGSAHADGWESQHRVKYVIHKAGGPAAVYRLAGYLAGTPAAQMYGDLQWVTDKKELEVSSNVPQKHVAILPEGTALEGYDVVVVAGRAILVGSQSERVSGFTEGYGILQASAAPTSVQLISRTYSPATSSYTDTTSAPLAAMKVRWQELFAYEDQAAERFQEGDCTWVLPATAAVTTTSVIRHGSADFAVMAVRAAYGCKLVHARAQ
jgi:hypothetical protein